MKDIFEKNEFDVIEMRKSATHVLAACQMFIAYLAQHVSPKEGPPRRLFQLLLIFSLNSLALLLNAVLPKRYEYFCNSIVLARKPS